MAWTWGISPNAPIEVAEGTPGSIPGPVPTEYAIWLAASLSNYEKLARTLVKHRAEKGRIVESVVKKALRGILPGRFSIGTGFAISASGQTSGQLDLVIYDGHFNSAVILEGETGLFPIECMYGFVEVKSVLNREEIEKFTKTVRTVRDLASEKRYVVYGERDDGEGNKVVDETEVIKTLPPRSFLFAINSDYANIDSVEAALKKYAEINGAHIHGVAVLESDWFIAQKATFGGPSEFVYKESGALATFCINVLTCIQSMTMLPASMSRYLANG